jgi:hypothetical protein
MGNPFKSSKEGKQKGLIDYYCQKGSQDLLVLDLILFIRNL